MLHRHGRRAQRKPPFQRLTHTILRRTKNPRQKDYFGDVILGAEGGGGRAHAFSVVRNEAPMRNLVPHAAELHYRTHGRIPVWEVWFSLLAGGV
jgi:hypothetical protein